MDAPTAHAKAPDAHEAHPEHITSWAPIVIAFGAAFVGLSLIWPMYLLPVGVPIMGVGLGYWIYQDVQRFRRAQDVAHAGSGLPGPVLGTIFFIATEVLIFGSIFALWFVGKFQQGASWGFVEGREIQLPIFTTGINTAILVASGATLHWGYLGLKKDNHARFRIGLALTILLGAVFLGLQVREYLELIHLEDFTIQSHIYGSTFYMLTGTHGAHVAGGLFALVIVLLRAMQKTQTGRRHVLLESVALYWHFVDVVWLFLFAVVYLEWI